MHPPLRRAMGPVFLFLQILLYLPLTLAIFEDEAYRIDFQHALVGTPHPERTFFHRPSPNSRASLLYTFSSQLVLAAVNPKDGALVWRQDLGEDLRHVSRPTPSGGLTVESFSDGLTSEDQTARHRAFLATTPGATTLVTALNNSVRAWDAANGHLVWEWHASGPVSGLTLARASDNDADVFVVVAQDSQNAVIRLAAADGAVRWEQSDKNDNTPLALAADVDSLYLISALASSRKNHKLRVSILDPQSGTTKQSLNLDAEGEFEAGDILLSEGLKASAPILAWTDASYQKIKINRLGSKGVLVLPSPSSADVPIERVSIKVSDTSKDERVLVTYQSRDRHWAKVLEAKSGNIKQLQEVPPATGIGSFAISEIDGQTLVSRHQSGKVEIMSLEDKKPLESYDIRTKDSKDQNIEPGAAAYASAEIVPKTGGGFAIRAALVLPSGDWQVIRDAEVTWTRHESLAGIVAAAWADPSPTEELISALEAEKHSNIVSAYIHRVRRHLRDLRGLGSWVEASHRSLLSGLSSLDSIPSDEAFGFHKKIIVATRKGRVACLDFQRQGQVIWNTQAVQLQALQDWDVADLRVSENTAIVSAVGGEILSIDLGTGQVESHQAPDSQGAADVFLTVADGERQSGIIGISKQGTPVDLPSTDSSQNTVVVTRRDDGSIAGWNVVDGASLLLWTFKPSPGSRLVSVVSRPPYDPVASIGQALGDRNVLYKYLSTNLIVLVTVDDANHKAAVYLLDTITGRTLYTTVHEAIDTSQSVSAAFSENWIAYSLTSDPSLSSDATLQPSIPKGNTLTVAELFESILRNDRGPLGPATNYSVLNSEPLIPHVVSATYVVPAKLRALTATTTRQGITPRSLLGYSAAAAAIMALPVPRLSPRRPVGRESTPAEMEEGLYRYWALLDFPAQWMLNHRRELLGIRNITVSPTAMESTSLVFAYGDLDVFGTRLSPIGGFDVLGRGFNRVSLILTVLVLAAGTAFLAPMVRRKQINTLWRK